MSTLVGQFLRKNCPLCGEVGFSLLWRLDVFDIVVCRHCNHRFVHNPWTEERLGEYYSDHFAKDAWYRQEQERFVRRRRRMVHRALQDFGTGKDVFEIGCGCGHLLDFLCRSGFEVGGCEPSGVQHGFATKSLGLSLFRGTLEEYVASNAEEQGHGAIIFLNVIEHILEPVSFVAAVRRLLRPGGIVIIETDNFASRIAHDFGERFWMNIPHVHVQQWTPATLRLALTGGGFEVVRETYWAEPENVAWHLRHYARRLLGRPGPWQTPYREPQLSAPPPNGTKDGRPSALKRIIALTLLRPLCLLYRTSSTGTKMCFVARAPDG